MTDETFVRGLLPQLRAVARAGEFTFVTRLRLVVGVHHGLAEEEIVRQLDEAFAAGACGDAFDDAVVEVVVTRPGDELPAPGRSDTMTASGWEVLVAKIEGRRADEDDGDE